MEQYEYLSEIVQGYSLDELSPLMVELIQNVAEKAVESGLVVNPEGAARDYIDHLLPA